tara:strand:- start:2234 stop:2656 length:423 start_codon:yes stop_codon:yes gene_type:complete
VISKLKSYLLLYFTWQFLYFIFSGGAASLLNWSARMVLRLYLDLIPSAVVSYFLGLTCAFLLYRRFVFPFSQVPIKTQSTRFLLIHVCAMPIFITIFSQLAIIFDNIELGDLSEPLAYAIALSIQPLVTFFLYKFFAFED